MPVQIETRARATNAQIRYAGNGSLQAVVELYVKSPERYAGATVLWFGSFKGKAAEHTIRQLKTMGWQGDVNNLKDCLAKDVRLSVSEQENAHGQTRLKAEWVNELTREIPGKAVDADALAQLQALVAEVDGPPSYGPGDDF